MKNGSTLFLKLIISLIGSAVIVLIAVLTISIGGDWKGLFFPILIIIYVTAIPFFFALCEAFKLLLYIDKNIAFSQLSIKALQNIKHCAMTISAFYVAGMPFLFFVADKDDAPGIVAFGFIFIFVSIVVATIVAVLQRLLQNGLDMKSENDLAT